MKIDNPIPTSEEFVFKNPKTGKYHCKISDESFSDFGRDTVGEAYIDQFVVLDGTMMDHNET